TNVHTVTCSRALSLSAIAALTLTIAFGDDGLWRISDSNSIVHRLSSIVAEGKVAQAAPQSQPASMPFADSAFERVWLRNDQPVASQAVARSWTWGPAPLASGLEPYADAPDGSGMRL